MGNQVSTKIQTRARSEERAHNINLQSLLRDAMRLAYVTLTDLYAYREEIKPAIDKITKNTEKIVRIKVHQAKIYEDATRRYLGKVKQLGSISNPIHETPVIEFTDADKLDVDGSGFRREYYSVYFRECIANMFEGNGRQMIPRKDCTKKDELKALGIAIVECILNGDCGFPYLNTAVYKKIIGCDSDTIDKNLRNTDIPDGEVRIIAEQISNATTQDELSEVVSSNEASFLNYVGWPAGQKMTMSNRDVLLQCITRWYIIDHRVNEIEQIRQGLNYMGFLDTIKSNPWFEPLFVYSEQYCITASYMKDKLNPVLNKLEPINEKEAACKKFAAECIQSIDDQQARLLFAFITNLNDPPIVEEAIDVRFNRHRPESTLPESQTCLNVLLLPLGNKDVDSFKDAFWTAIVGQIQ